ncbi:MAG: hypothetical protein P8X82_04360 [Gemmatimonadales bacterium]
MAAASLRRALYTGPALGVAVAVVALFQYVPFSQHHLIAEAVTGAATVGLALVAYLTIKTERQRRKELLESVHDTIAVHAYVLKRSIDKALERSWPVDGWSMDEMKKWASRFQLGYPHLVPRADTIAIEAGKASPEVADQARAAFSYFYQAVGRINEVQAGEYQDLEQARLQLMKARNELEQGSKTLEPLTSSKYHPPTP